MIAVNELKINNNIWHTCLNLNTNEIDNFVVTVNGNLIKELELHPHLPYNPIPLTPEILIACGFKEIYTSEFTRRFEHHKNMFIEYVFSERGVGTYAKYYGHPINKIVYLHQLQNLCLVLSGEELTFNPSLSSTTTEKK